MSGARKSRIYELYDGMGGPTCYSKHYGMVTKQVWRVRAVSVRQAYYLAANDRWAESADGVGIQSRTPNAAESQWRHWDGTKSWG